MKIAKCVVWILHRKLCKFGDKSYYNSRVIELFLGVSFLVRSTYLCKLRVTIAWTRSTHTERYSLYSTVALVMDITTVVSRVV